MGNAGGRGKHYGHEAAAPACHHRAALRSARTHMSWQRCDARATLVRGPCEDPVIKYAALRGALSRMRQQDVCIGPAVGFLVGRSLATRS